MINGNPNSFFQLFLLLAVLATAPSPITAPSGTMVLRTTCRISRPVRVNHKSEHFMLQTRDREGLINTKALPYEVPGPVDKNFNPIKRSPQQQPRRLKKRLFGLTFGLTNLKYIPYYYGGSHGYTRYFYALDVLGRRRVFLKRIGKTGSKFSFVSANVPKKLSDMRTISRTVKDPALAPVVHVYQDPLNWNIVMPLILGRELFHYIAELAEKQENVPEDQLVPLPEEMVRRVIYQLLHALAKLHQNNIVFGDIKAENVMVQWSNPNDPTTVRATFVDLGCAKILTTDHAREPSACATVAYLSPDFGWYPKAKQIDQYYEASVKNQNKPIENHGLNFPDLRLSDSFALGAMTYAALSLKYPWDVEVDDWDQLEWLQCKLNQPLKKYKSFSPVAWDFIQSATAPENHRLSSFNLLKHNWFNGL